MDEPSELLLENLKEKICFGENLISQLDDILEVDGAPKLQRKVRQEVLFLKKLQSTGKVKEEQLTCSNLRHLGAMVECSLRPGVCSICRMFHCEGNKIVIDIVSEGGRIWTKVIARNPKSLSALSQGNASYGARSILDQAEDYMECARLHPCMYQPPQVIFEFMSGIEENLASKLRNIGVMVKGDIIPNFVSNYSEDESWDSDSSSGLNTPFHIKSHHNDVSESQIPEDLEITTLNLDVTAMMAYVSNMTNGYCKFRFKQPVLTQQAIWESKRPVKPELEKLFKGKKLVCCQTAWEDFEKIVNTLGGINEKIRTEELRSKLTVLPDEMGGVDEEIRAKLKVRGRVRLRSKTVFNFGHRIKALTVSANDGFVRAASQQGLTYAAFIHESRALTEEKEATATPILDP